MTTLFATTATVKRTGDVARASSGGVVLWVGSSWWQPPS